MHDAGGKCVEATTHPIPVDCPVVFPLCIGTPPICQCEVNGCHAWELPTVTFDLTFDGRNAEGTTNPPGFANGMAYVHLRFVAD